MRRLAVMALCALVLPASAQAWTWPVDGPVLRAFSFDRAHPYADGQPRGVDLAAPSGTRVVAPARGVVTFAGTDPTGGKTVSIETPLGYTATLVHLGSIAVQRGTSVTEGAVVGTVGPSGVADHAEPYVYFGLRTTQEEQGYVDPLAFLPSRPAAVPPTAPARDPAPAEVVAVAAPAPAVAPAEPAVAPALSPAEPAAPAAVAPPALVVAAAAPAAAPASAAAERRATEPVNELPISHDVSVRRVAAPRDEARARATSRASQAPRLQRVLRAHSSSVVQAVPAQ